MALSDQAIFLDKDGTLIENIPFNVDPKKIVLNRGAREAIELLKGIFQFHLVTNQAGVSFGMFKEEDLVPVFDKLSLMFNQMGTQLHGIHYCPHHPGGKVSQYAIHCQCRKPSCKMLRKAAQDYGIDLSRSWMIGDILDDVEAGNRAGCRTILINNGNETQWLKGPYRWPDFIVSNLEEAAHLIFCAEEDLHAVTRSHLC